MLCGSKSYWSGIGTGNHKGCPYNGLVRGYFVPIVMRDCRD